MIGFYIELVGTYFKAMARGHYEFEPEDVFVLRDLSILYNSDSEGTMLDGVLKTSEFKMHLKRKFDLQFWQAIDVVLRRLDEYNFTESLQKTRLFPQQQAQFHHTHLKDVT